MKLVLVLSSKGRGGMERAFLDWVSMLSRRGHVLHCVLPRRSWAWGELERLKGSLDRPVQMTGVSGFGRLNLLTIWRLMRVLRSEPWAVVVSHGARAAPLTYLARPRKLPHVAVTHQASRLALWATHLIALTAQLKQFYTELGFPEERITVIPNALPDHGAIPPAARMAATEPLRVGVIGRLVPKKGVDVFLRAFRRALDRGLTAQAFIAGSGGEEAKLQDLVRDLALTQHVRFMGWIEQPMDFFSAVDIACIPSLSEPFGIVALEALASGTAVIASSVGGLSDTIRDGQQGLLVPPGDVEALAAAITRLATDSSERARLRETGLARAAEYSRPAIAERIESSLYRLVSSLA